MRRLLFGLLLMPFVALAQSLDSLHIIVDAEALNVGVPYVYKTFQDAAVHFVDGVTVYVKPGVYWIDDPDDPTVRVGENGREPFGMVVRWHLGEDRPREPLAISPCSTSGRPLCRSRI